MSISKVATRYAESFLSTAIEKSVLSEVSDDLNFILETINASEDLRRFLNSPIIKTELKKSIIKEIFSNKISINSLKFLEFVVEKRREEFLINILHKFNELKDDYLGIVRLEIKSAFQLTEQLKATLLKKFEEIFNKKIEANFIIDEKLLGGFFVKHRDTVFDASISHQLEKLKNNLISGSFTLN
jgi:F-type H+-transporting ATPase subunit delta